MFCGLKSQSLECLHNKKFYVYLQKGPHTVNGKIMLILAQIVPINVTLT